MAALLFLLLAVVMAFTGGGASWIVAATVVASATAGTLLPAVADLWGMAPVPVAGGGSDNAAGAAGVGALKGCAAPGEQPNLISMEIGGTSCDVMVMAKGDVAMSDQLIIDGYHLTTPSVEIHTVGAGGGTVAWVDAAGLLHAGPHGAGARPGPAAYGCMRRAGS